MPPELVRDVDLFDLPGAADDVHLAWKAVQDANPDVFFAPRHGGYWIVTRAELIAAALPDHERFSSDKAVAIPAIPGTPPQVPLESDPPLHGFYRRPLNVALSPRAVRLYTEEARALAIELIEAARPRGGCEFMADFARHLPMTIFLRLVDLPIGDRAQLIGLAETMIRGGSPQVKFGALMETFGYLGSWIERRREAPGDDLLSRIVDMQIEGRAATQEEALGECALVLFGGLDTVAGTMGFVARFLAEHDEHRRALAADPSLIPAAIEELLRRHSIPIVGRRVVQDITFGGVQMRAGDKVMLVTALHGLDERAWAEPLSVDFGRDVQGHQAFGAGVHKCPGANLARAELRVFLEEWLKRIPEFRIAPDDRAATLPGQVLGVAHLPLVWAA